MQPLKKNITEFVANMAGWQVAGDLAGERKEKVNIYGLF